MPQKRKRGRPRKNNSDNFGSLLDGEGDDADADSDEKPKKCSGRGRKKIVPMSLKMCSECGEEFQDHASNLTHWKDKHPGMTKNAFILLIFSELALTMLSH